MSNILASEELEKRRIYDKKYYEVHKEKCAAKNKKYSEEHREELIDYQKQYREDNKDKIKAKRKIYDEKHKERRTTYNKNYWEENKDKLSEQNKKYFEENKDKLLKQQKIYIAKNKEKIAARSKKYNSAHREELNNYQKQYRKENKKEKYILNLLAKLMSRAKRKNMPFDLEEDDIYIPKLCPVLKIPLVKFGKYKYDSPSIDRIDNNKGYTKDNIIVMSFAANALKNDMLINEWKNILQINFNKTEEEINKIIKC